MEDARIDPWLVWVIEKTMTLVFAVSMHHYEARAKTGWIRVRTMYQSEVLYLLVPEWSVVSTCTRVKCCIYLYQSEVLYLLVPEWSVVSTCTRVKCCIYLYQSEVLYLLVPEWSVVSTCTRVKCCIYLYQSEVLYLLVPEWSVVSTCTRVKCCIYLGTCFSELALQKSSVACYPNTKRF